jgi:hypothetical protein
MRNSYAGQASRTIQNGGPGNGRPRVSVRHDDEMFLRDDAAAMPRSFDKEGAA